MAHEKARLKKRTLSCLVSGIMPTPCHTQRRGVHRIPSGPYTTHPTWDGPDRSPRHKAARRPSRWSHR